MSKKGKRLGILPCLKRKIGDFSKSSIKRVMILKSKNTFLWEQNTKEINEDISSRQIEHLLPS